MDWIGLPYQRFKLTAVATLDFTGAGNAAAIPKATLFLNVYPMNQWVRFSLKEELIKSLVYVENTDVMLCIPTKFTAILLLVMLSIYPPVHTRN